MTKRVLLAKPRGYCAGVDRAVATVESRGVVFVEEADEVPTGAVVVFSAHGVSPAVHEQAAARGLRTIDATCPLVTKVHQEAKRFGRDGYEILLIGHQGHEEVAGTTGEAPERVRLVERPDDVASVRVDDPER